MDVGRLSPAFPVTPVGRQIRLLRKITNLHEPAFQSQSLITFFAAGQCASGRETERSVLFP
jgi:hypothetical protein